MPLRAIITAGTEADCKQATALIAEIEGKGLIADRGYDTNEIVAQATKQGMEVVIPPKKNRTVKHAYNKEIYKLRHRVENALLHLKRWRGIATRYFKKASSFLAAIHIRCIMLWVNNT